MIGSPKIILGTQLGAGLYLLFCVAYLLPAIICDWFMNKKLAYRAVPAMVSIAISFNVLYQILWCSSLFEILSQFILLFLLLFISVIDYEKNENEISKDRFSERGVLYIVLSIVALILYVFLFGAEEVLYDELEEKDPQWVCWWIFAVGAFCFGGIAGYYRMLWSRDFVVVGASIMAMSFFRFQNEFYLSEPEKMISMFGVIIIVVGLSYFGRKPFNETWIGLLPVILGILYIFVGHTYVVVCVAGISLVLLSVVSYKRASVAGRWVFAVGVVVFYLGVTFVYVPLNPFLLSENVEAIIMNRYQRYNNSTLVVRDNSKYHIIDGLTGDSVVHAEFELYENPVLDCPGVGYKLDFTNTYSGLYDPIGSKITSFPVMTKDSCVYFITDIPVYKKLETICSAVPADTAQAILKIKHHTAKLFYDYIAMFQNKDSVAYEKLSKRHKSLYDTILAAVTDTRLLNDIDVRIDERLRIYTRYLTLGLLNAVSMDMLKNSDYANLASVFSQQFYMTFFDDEVIYRRVNVNNNFNVSIGGVEKLMHSLIRI